MRERPNSDDEAADTDRCLAGALPDTGGLALRKSYVSREHSPNPPVVRVVPSGHQVHWIHAKKAHEPQPEIAVVVTVHDDGHVELDGDDLHLSLWHHGPARLQSVLDQAGHHGLWKPRFHALFAPRYGGRIFNLAALDHLTPCVADDDHSPAYTAETVLERAARHARERGGYTVRLNSLRAER